MSTKNQSRRDKIGGEVVHPQWQKYRLRGQVTDGLLSDETWSVAGEISALMERYAERAAEMFKDKRYDEYRTLSDMVMVLRGVEITIMMLALASEPASQNNLARGWESALVRLMDEGVYHA